MREIIESGFKIMFQKEAFFRFSEMNAYRKISGKMMKEMDAAWWKHDNKGIYLIELKGVEVWDAFDKSKSKAIDHMVKTIQTKVTDTLLMLSAIWAQTEIGTEFKNEVPECFHTYPGKGKIKLRFVIDMPKMNNEKYKHSLMAVKDKINKELAGRLHYAFIVSASEK